MSHKIAFLSYFALHLIDTQRRRRRRIILRTETVTQSKKKEKEKDHHILEVSVFEQKIGHKNEPMSEGEKEK